MGNIDILIITESKLDETFPDSQFTMDGNPPPPPFRCDRNSNGGGIIIYAREDIPWKELKELKVHHIPQLYFLEGIFLEVNLKKSKWLLFGGYNPSKDSIPHFLHQLSSSFDKLMHNYDNIILLGDFNSEFNEPCMKDFCETYNLSKFIKLSTCFKNPANPSSIDVILTSRTRSFQEHKVVETGLSDHHKMTITVLKKIFPKQKPAIVKYRNYKKFDLTIFCSELSVIAQNSAL